MARSRLFLALLASVLLWTSLGEAWAVPSAPSAPVAIAEANIGRGETFADNSGPWVERYTRGSRVAWCAAFVSYVYKEAGYRIPYTLRARDFLKIGERRSKPVAGDVVVFRRGSTMGHVAIIVKVVDAKNFWVIEGNHGRFPAKVKRSFVSIGERGREVLGFIHIGSEK